MKAVLDYIEAHDAQKLGGDTYTWQIRFYASASLGLGKWVLPWQPSGDDLLARMLEELDSGEL